LIDPRKIALAERAARRETPIDAYIEAPTREERQRAFVKSALEEAFAISSKEVVNQLEALVAERGFVDLLDLPVEDARSLLLALCAVESVRGENDGTKLDVSHRSERRDNGVFKADDFRFSQRA
jgi:hypothetical protein